MDWIYHNEIKPLQDPFFHMTSGGSESWFDAVTERSFSAK